MQGMLEVRISSYACDCMRMNRAFVSCERQPVRYTITVPLDFSRKPGSTCRRERRRCGSTFAPAHLYFIVKARKRVTGHPPLLAEFYSSFLSTPQMRINFCYLYTVKCERCLTRKLHTRFLVPLITRWWFNLHTTWSSLYLLQLPRNLWIYIARTS